MGLQRVQVKRGQRDKRQRVFNVGSLLKCNVGAVNASGQCVQGIKAGKILGSGEIMVQRVMETRVLMGMGS